MIDPSLFTVESILAAMFDDMHGNVDVWRKHAEIVPDYMPPFPSEDTRPTCVVRIRRGNDWGFLRYSCGPSQGVWWDVYGSDFLRPEIALLALLTAPIPPWLVRRDALGGAP